MALFKIGNQIIVPAIPIYITKSPVKIPITVPKVRYIDYNGDVLLEIESSKFSPSMIPIPPTHDRLTFQEWTQDLSIDFDVNNWYDVGATYITSSGDTEIDIEILPTQLNKNMQIALQMSIAGTGCIIEWGDGNVTNTVTTVARTVYTNTYSEFGKYTIKIRRTIGTGTYQIIGTSTTVVGFGTIENASKVIACKFGDNVIEIGSYAFYQCNTLQSVVIPNSITSLGNFYAFYRCVTLKSIVIPNLVTSVGNYTISNCYNLESIVIPTSIDSFGVFMFPNGYSLKSIVIPNSVTSFGTNTFQACYSLKSIVIPTSVAQINDTVFQNTNIICYEFKSIIPPTVGTTIFLGILPNTKIYVPDESLDAYKNATNLTIYANYMYPKSQQQYHHYD